ncbi:MarR family winged helix-turn-helix transcriptional regulator [Pseudonocardia xinjiangensis]|uniref:Winged helix-turn-helix transcriptional regulator n=1 Tax=Pseudonocardia xinjiangensis TaxID=75289 RepID=A0ABX1RA52_9PSEU|nr:MarR family winged helix-turn-helix transcriptional regulator [Pseudonocardia xinjiangensis]NMH76294.1 winged helix-turn-helix transcriptional regulator [Pseudonocardia xinjiangensis]
MGGTSGGGELDQLTVAVRRLGDASRELNARKARELGMNTTDMTALYLLEQHGPMGVVDLARRLGIRAASGSAMLDRLERAGHVHRAHDARDRRRITVAITDDARCTSAEAWHPVISAIDEVSGSLPPDERAAVLDYLRRVAAAMEDR